MPDNETMSEVNVIARRRLILAATPERASMACKLEIGFPQGEPPLGEGKAAFRIDPVMDWVWIYGVDQIQALELTVRMAEMEAKAWGADWPEDDDAEPISG